MISLFGLEYLIIKNYQNFSLSFHTFSVAFHPSQLELLYKLLKTIIIMKLFETTKKAIIISQANKACLP